MKLLEQYEIIQKTDKLILSNRYGEHANQTNGNSNDFKDIIPYTSEQNIKDINWKSSSKSGTILTNRYYDSKEANIVLLYICSGSMQYGKPRNKHNIATEIITSLSHAIITKNDSLSTIYHSADIKTHYPKTKSKTLPHQNYSTMLSLNLIGNSPQYNTLQDYIGSNVKEKSIIFIIGDFLQKPMLDSISKQHAINCIILRDKSEEILSLKGAHHIYDTNSAKSQRLNITSKSAKKYNKAMQEHDDKLEFYFSQLGIKSQKIYTHDDSIMELSHLMKKQIW